MVKENVTINVSGCKNIENTTATNTEGERFTGLLAASKFKQRQNKYTSGKDQR